MRFAVLSLLLAVSVGIMAQPPGLDEVRRLVREYRLDEALSAIDARLAVDPGNRQARFLKGVVLAERQQDEEAIEVFTALTRDYPELPEPYNNLAVLYASRGDYEAARDALMRAINTHPSYATAHENLGDIYAKMAGLAYSRALSLDTGNAGAKDKLALLDDLFTRGPMPTTVASAERIPAPVAEPAPQVTPAAATAPASPPVAVTAAAAPAPAASATAVRGARDDVISTIESWAAAWSAQDVERYLEHYLDGASPEAGVSRARWESVRRDRLTRPEFIEIDVDSFQVRGTATDRMEVTFVQGYRSNTYADRVRKRVALERTAEGWKISEERTLAKL